MSGYSCHTRHEQSLTTAGESKDDDEEALYRSNIQVADLNALNAALAVMRWKQYMGFYLDQELAHNLNFTLPFQSLTRSDAPS